MADWMYAHTLPPHMHPQGCTCGGCDGSSIFDEDFEYAGPELDATPELKGTQECPVCDGIMVPSCVFPHDRWACTVCGYTEDD